MTAEVESTPPYASTSIGDQPTVQPAGGLPAEHRGDRAREGSIAARSAPRTVDTAVEGRRLSVWHRVGCSRARRARAGPS